MKHIKILEEKYSHEEKTELFSDIYTLVINNVVDLVFIPDLNYDFTIWPPADLCSYDNINQTNEAKLYALLAHRYGVVGTRNQDLVARGNLVLKESYVDDHGVAYPYSRIIYFIPNDEMNEIIKSIESVYNDWDFTEERMNTEGLKDFAFGKCINKILESEHFLKKSFSRK